MSTQPEKPQMSDEGLDASVPCHAIDEFGAFRPGQIAAERALTVFIDKREIVTLMTLGTQPELLILGWLRNQRFIQDISDIRSIQVDWETEAVAVTTRNGVKGLEDKLAHKTVTTGCGQGTVFGKLMADVHQIQLTQPQTKQSTIYDLLKALSEYNEVYKKAGGVHGCALCRQDAILRFVEDVGRHNAVDALAGYMWLNDIDGADKVFYTTGRLTSEMVIKVAQMGVPVLLSRSGITQMGLAIAKRIGVTLIARAKGRHFLIYNGADHVVFDAIPPNKTKPAAKPQVEHARS